MNASVDFYFSKANKWQEEIRKLRMIVLDCGLSEELKWGVPCYTFPASAGRQVSNIVLIHVFKEYCAVLFFKGALLKDANAILIQQTKKLQRDAKYLRSASENVYGLLDAFDEHLHVLPVVGEIERITVDD